MRIRGTRTVLRAEQSDKRTSTRSARVPQSKKKLHEREWNGEGTYTFACNQLYESNLEASSSLIAMTRRHAFFA